MRVIATESRSTLTATFPLRAIWHRCQPTRASASLATSVPMGPEVLPHDRPRLGLPPVAFPTPAAGRHDDNA